MNTRYWRDACRATTASGVSPETCAIDARSGPASPPYTTGTSTTLPASSTDAVLDLLSSASTTALRSLASGSKNTATDRNVGTTSRTPRMRRSRTTLRDANGADVDLGVDLVATLRLRRLELKDHRRIPRFADGHVVSSPCSAPRSVRSQDATESEGAAGESTSLRACKSFW